MIDNYLELTNVSKNFSGFTLNDISFTLPKGYIMGLVGPNGAGKTTTIQLIMNMLQKNGGNISVFGKDHIKHENSIKQDIGMVFDSSFYVDTWTIKDTEKAISPFYTDWNHEIFIQMIDRFKLPTDRKVKNLSKGMQMKLMLACAFSHNAKLLILDEPTSGLDPATRDSFLRILQDYIKDGERSVLFSTHITSDLDRVADYITFLNEGQVYYTGSTEAMIANFRIIKGRNEELNPQLEKQIIGLEKTAMGFEGLIPSAVVSQYKNFMIEAASINDIVVKVSHGGN